MILVLLHLQYLEKTQRLGKSDSCPQLKRYSRNWKIFSKWKQRKLYTKIWCIASKTKWNEEWKKPSFVVKFTFESSAYKNAWCSIGDIALFSCNRSQHYNMKSIGQQWQSLFFLAFRGENTCWSQAGVVSLQRSMVCKTLDISGLQGIQETAWSSRSNKKKGRETRGSEPQCCTNNQ